MKTKLTLWSLIFCSLVTVFAQQPTWEMSKSFRKGLSFYAYLFPPIKSQKGSYYYSLVEAGFSKQELMFFSYDKDLKINPEKNFDVTTLLPDKGFENIQSFYYWNDSIYALVANTDRKAETKDMYVFTSPLNDIRMSNPRKLTTLTNVKTIAFGTSVEQVSNYIFKTALSNDSSKVVIAYMYDNGPKKPQSIFIQVWTAGFEKVLWEKEQEIPYSKTNSNFNSVYVDNDANVYFLFNVRNENKNMKRDAKYNILRISELGEEVSDNTIDLGTNTAKDLKLFFDKNGDMLACAYYYVKDALLGVFISRYPTSMKDMPQLQYHTFEKDIDADKRKDPKFKTFMDMLLLEQKKELNYVLQYVIPEDNGDITLIGEDQYITFHTTYEGGKTGTAADHHNDDVIVTRLDNTGKIIWTQRIPKRNMNMDVGFPDRTGVFPEKKATYSYMKRGSDILIFYNDSPLNSLSSEKILDPYNSTTSVLAMATINEKGEAKREVIESFTSSKESGMRPLIRTMKPISENEALIGIVVYPKEGGVKFTVSRLKW